MLDIFLQIGPYDAIMPIKEGTAPYINYAVEHLLTEKMQRVGGTSGNPREVEIKELVGRLFKCCVPFLETKRGSNGTFACSVPIRVPMASMC
jgi:hypothetical protein